MNDKLEKRITDLILTQVPEFIRNDHPEFVSFMEAYYEWMETKFNREIVSANDGITIKFEGNQLNQENKIILDNLTFEQSISIYSYLTIGSYLTSKARYIENRGPFPVSRKEVNRLSGSITSITELSGPLGMIKVTSPQHDLGYLGDEVELTITDTVNYNGKYIATIIDDDSFSLNNNFVGNEYSGSWFKNYITIYTDDLLSNEILKPNKITIEEFSENILYPGMVMVKSPNHQLTNNLNIVIVDSPHYYGSHIITIIDEDYFMFSGTYSGNDENSSWLLPQNKIPILSFESWSGIPSDGTIIYSPYHGLNDGVIIDIVDSIHYSGVHSVEMIDSNYFKIAKEYQGNDPNSSWVRPSSISPTLTENGDYIGSLFSSKKLLTYSDVDETIDQFMTFFNKEFLVNIPISILCDRSKLIKNIQSFYKARGTEKSWKLLFRILYNEKISFYYPVQDILKVDDGKWFQDQSIIVRLIENPDDIFNPEEEYLNKRIIGKTSGATGFVKEIRKHWNGISYVYELIFEKLTITGTFVPQETVSLSLTSEFNESTILPILQDIEITNPGTGYNYTDTITITTPYDNTISMGASINSLGPLGEILSVIITDHSLGYPVYPVDSTPDEPIVTFTSKILPNITATGKAIIGALITYKGRYITQDGFLDNIKKLRDDYFYQEFSYVVNTTGTCLEFFKNICKKLVHPAGLIMFCKVLIENKFDTQKANISEYNDNYKSKMLSFGRTILGKELKGFIKPGSSNRTFKIESDIWNPSSLIGFNVISYKKSNEIQNEFSNSYITSNQNNIVTVDSNNPLFPNCDTIVINGNIYRGNYIDSTTFQLDDNIWEAPISWNTLVSLSLYSYIKIPDQTFSLSNIVSNTNNTIVVDVPLEPLCDTIKINNGSKEYYGIRLDDYTFKVEETLWPDDYLIGKLAFTYDYSDKHATNTYSLIVSNTKNEITVNTDLYPYTIDRLRIYEISHDFDHERETVLLKNSSLASENRILYTDLQIKSLYDIYESHLTVGSNYKYLERNLKRTLPLPGNWPWYERYSKVKGTRISDTLFVSDNPIWNINSLVGKQVYSFIAGSRDSGNISTILSNTDDNLVVDALTPLFPGCNRIEIIGVPYKSYFDTMEQRIPVSISGVRTADNIFTASGTPWTTNDSLVGYSVYSYNSLDRNNASYSIVLSNTSSVLTTVVGNLYPSCDRIELEQIPIYNHYKDIINIDKRTGTRTSDTIFTLATSEWVPNSLIGKKVYSYNSTNKNNRYISEIIANTDTEIIINGLLYQSCDTIEVILDEINNYWNFYANYQIGTEFGNYNLKDFNHNQLKRVYICPEPRIYQLNNE